MHEISVKPLIDNDLEYSGEISSAYTALLIITPLIFYLKKSDAFLKGLNKINLYNHWNSFFYVVNFVVLFILIQSNYSIFYVFIVSQFLILLNSFKNFYLLRSRFNGSIDLRSFDFSKTGILELWKPTWKSAIISLSSTGTASLVNVFVPRFFGLQIGGIYLFSVKIIQIINEFSYAPFYSKIPIYIKNYKRGFTNSEKKNILVDSIKSIIVLVLGIIVLNLTGNKILNLINSDMRIFEGKIILYYTLFLIIERTTGMKSQIKMFSNNIEHYPLYLLSCLIFSILFYINRNGTIDFIPLAGLISYLIILSPISKQAHKILDIRIHISLMYFLSIFLILVLAYIIL